jgi:hypothetical protein
MKINLFLSILVSIFMLPCCSGESNPPSTYDELEERISSAFKKNDVQAIESLFWKAPQQWEEARKITLELVNVLSSSGFSVRRGAVLNSPLLASQSWDLEPQEFLRVQGTADETASVSIGFYLGKTKNGAYIVYPSGSNNTRIERELTFDLVSTPEVNLGEKLPQTFQSSWSGNEAKSYSMDNLAAALSRFSGVKIINKTGIEGDYNFTLILNAAQDPTNIKLDLQSVGLDLVESK